MWEELRTLVDAALDNPLEVVPRFMVRDFCEENEIERIVMWRWPRAVVISPQEALALAAHRTIHDYLARSPYALQQLILGTRNGEYGLPEKLFGLDVFINSDREELPLALEDYQIEHGYLWFYEWATAVWNDYWPNVKLVPYLPRQEKSRE